MRLGRLLNQNVEVVSDDDHRIVFINSVNGQELMRVTSNTPLNYWINKGFFMTMEEAVSHQENAREEMHQLENEILAEEVRTQNA